jgi:DNA-directed RNA polymerase beta' subunit
MSTGNPRYAGYPLMDIKKVAFYLLVPEDMRRMAVTQITSSSLDIKDTSSAPGTLYDRKMGPIAESERCETCNQLLRDCPGHFGLVELPLPMPNPLFGKELTDLLSCFCNNILTETDEQGNEITRMCMCPLFSDIQIEQYRNLSAGTKFKRLASDPAKSCTRRASEHTTQAKWIYYTDRDPRATVANSGVKPFRLYTKGEGDVSPSFIPAGDLLRWLSYIPSKALRDLGLDSLRPESLILCCLPVIGNPMRLPSPNEGLGSGIIHHDLTQIYSRVIDTNQKLRTEKESHQIPFYSYVDTEETAGKVEELYKGQAYTDLCSAILHLFDNKDDACRDTYSGKGYKGILELIDGKWGLIRQNILAARCDKSARSVIIPDPNINLDEVGVPQVIAEKMMQEVTVTDDNIENIRTLAKMGKICSAITAEGRKVCLNQQNASQIPENVARLREEIARFEAANPGKEITNDHLKQVLGDLLSEDSTEATDDLDRLFQESEALAEEENNQSRRTITCIESIQPGDTVMRPLVDGDVVLMSRQPILRPENIMAHFVRVMPGLAFRISPGAGVPYNAD